MSLFAGLTVAHSGGSGHSGGNLKITAADLTSEPTTLFGTSAVAYVVLTSDSSDTTPQRDLIRGVKVQRTDPAGGDAVFIDLLEKDPIGGVFVGSFGFTTGAKVDPSCLAICDVDADDPWAWGNISGDAKVPVTGTASTVRVSKTIGTTEHFHDISWQNSADGVLCVASTSARNCPTNTVASVSSYEAQIFLKVTDVDLNTNNATRESYNVTLAATQDIVGETITIQEVGVDSAVFNGDFRFEGQTTSAPTATNGRVFVKTGDSVTVRYIDLVGLDGSTKSFSHTFVFFPSTTGTVAQGLTTYFGCTTRVGTLCSTNAAGTLGQVIVTDADLNDGTDSGSPFDDDLMDTVSVTVKSTSDATGISLTLNETTGSSGIFAGDYKFLHCLQAGQTDPAFPGLGACPARPAKTIFVREGDEVTATYSDAKNAAGLPVTPAPAKAVWHATVDGEFRSDAGRLGLNAAVYSGTDTSDRALAFIRLIDHDANLNVLATDHITVKVKSTSDPTAGLSVVLDETGANTGIFHGTAFNGKSFGFSTSATGNNRIRVADKDLVVVEYVDQRGAQAVSKVIRSEASVWRAPTTPTVFFRDLATCTAGTIEGICHLIRNGTGDYDPATKAFGAGSVYSHQGRVTIVDHDANHPFQRDTVTLLMRSEAATDIEIIVPETGTNSGTFSAPFFMCPGAGCSTPGNLLAVPPVIPRIQVDSGAGDADVISAQYKEGGITHPAVTADVDVPTGPGIPRVELGRPDAAQTAQAENPQILINRLYAAPPAANADFGGPKTFIIAVYTTGDAGDIKMSSTLCEAKKTMLEREGDGTAGKQRVKFEGAVQFKGTGACADAGNNVVVVDNNDDKRTLKIYHTPNGGVEKLIAEIPVFQLATTSRAKVQYVDDDLTTTISARTGYTRPFNVLVDGPRANLRSDVIDVWEMKACTFGTKETDAVHTCTGAVDSIGTYDESNLNTFGVTAVETGPDTGKFATSLIVSCNPAPGRNCLPFVSAAEDDKQLIIRSNANATKNAPPAEPNGILRLHFNDRLMGSNGGAGRKAILKIFPSPSAIVEVTDNAQPRDKRVFGTGQVVKLTLLEDNNAGRVLNRKIATAGAPSGNNPCNPICNDFPLGAVIAPNSEFIFVNATTTVQTSAGSPSTCVSDCTMLDTATVPQSAGGDFLFLPSCIGGADDICDDGSAQEPLVDDNRLRTPDNRITCDDIRFLQNPTDHVAMNGFTPCYDLAAVPMEPELGKVPYKLNTCVDSGGGSTNCKSRVMFRYKAAADAGPTTRYEYQIQGDKVHFGQNLGKDSEVYADYTPAAISVVVSSVLGGDSETVSLTYDNTDGSSTRGKYVGTFITETAANTAGKLKVNANGDTIRVVHKDLTAADGLATSDVFDHFRASVDLASWRPAQTAAIDVTGRDYGAGITGKVYGRFVFLKVVDADSDRTSQRDEVVVTVSSIANGGDKVVAGLRETGPNTGDFRGIIEFNAPTAVIANDAILQMTGTASAQFRATYRDPHLVNGPTQNVEITRQWGPSGDATEIAAFTAPPGETGTPGGEAIATCPAILGLGAVSCRIFEGADDQMFVRVKDADADTSTGADTIQVRLASTSDPTGELFTLKETGQSTATFLLQNEEIRFEKTRAVANNKKVFVRENDLLFLSYRDERSDTGNLREIPWNFPGSGQLNLTWEDAFDADFRMLFTSFAGTAKEFMDNEAGIIYGFVELRDADENKPVGTNPGSRVVNTLTIEVSTGATPAGVDVILVETSASSGVFSGKFGFWIDSDADVTLDSNVEETIAFSGRARLKVDEGQRARMTYVDTLEFATSSGDTTLTREASADWVPRGTGVVSFDRSEYTLEEQIANLTLIDGDRPGTATPKTQTVRVVSETDTTGVTITVTESDAAPGVYTGELGFSKAESSQTSSPPKIKVRDGLRDVVEARYTDASPGGTRSTQVNVTIGDVIPPVLTVTLDPAQPDGKNGWYKTEPTMTFAVNEPAIVSYAFDGGDVREWDQQPVTVPDGTEVIEAFAVDDPAGNVGDTVTVNVKVDSSPPLEVVQDLNATAVAGGKVQINWSRPATTENFGEYIVYRKVVANSTVLQAGTVTGVNTTSFTDDPLAEAEFQYLVKIASLAGLEGTPSGLSAIVRTDKTPPTITEATVTPSSFDVRDGITAIQLRAVASDANLQGVSAKVALSGTVLTTITLTGGAGGAFNGTYPVGPTTQTGSYTITFVASDLVGNTAEKVANLSVRGPDAAPPSITVVPAGPNAQIPQGQTIAVTVSDNVGLSLIEYKVDQGTTVGVTLPSGTVTSHAFTVPTANLALGAHTLVITAQDLPDQGVKRNGTLTYTFTLVEPPVPLPTNLFLSVSTKVQKDGTIKLSWNAPTEVGNKVVSGYIVWRAASPFARYDTVAAPTTAYHDKNTTLGSTYRYAVSWFAADGFGDVTAISQVPGFPGSEDDVGTTPVLSKESRGLTGLQWFLLVGLPLLAIAVLLAVFLVVRNRRQQAGGARRQEQVLVRPEAAAPPTEVAKPVAGPAAAPTGAPEQRHVLRCPQCQHRFEVFGRKPIVTNCPNCGRKGILR